MSAESYWSVVSNPAHIGAELTWSVILDLILLPFVKLAIRRHDRKRHS